MKKRYKNNQQEPRGNEEYNFWTEGHSRRNQNQDRWRRGLNQQAGRQGRIKLPESARK